MTRAIADPSRNAFLALPLDEHMPTSPVPLSLLKPLEPLAEKAFYDRFSKTSRELHRLLGPPFFAEDGYILYCGDCKELLSTLATVLNAELAITSPPYNIGKEYETPLPLNEFVAWCTTWLQHLYACTSAAGAFWLNLGYVSVPGRGSAVPLPYLLWDKLPFHLQQEVVWVYGAGVAAKRKLSPRNEKWLFLTKSERSYTFNLDPIRDPNVKYPNQRRNGRYRCNPLGKNPTDVWTVPKVTTGTKRSSKERTVHPAQFPLEIVERIVLACSNPSELVIDPFAGSGSTGVAAVGHGRVYFGIELREDYCSLAKDRFLRYRAYKRSRSAQATLFGASEG
jgi:adenine-specific DNA-methyltransferase